LIAQQGALAQSNVRIYGVADTGLLLTRHDGNALAKVESGIGATSRLGFTGTEDLGGGLTAADPTATLASFRNEWWGLGAQYRWDSVTVSYILNSLVPYTRF